MRLHAGNLLVLSTLLLATSAGGVLAESPSKSSIPTPASRAAELKQTVRGNSPDAAKLTAFAELKELADNGDANAAFYVAELYQAGIAVPTDISTAHGYFQMALDGGNPKALIQVANLLATGEVAGHEASEALPLYLSAATTDPKINLRLGDLYRDGIGVDRSATEAERYYLAARAAEAPGSEMRLADLYLASQDEGLDAAKGVEIYRTLDAQGNASASLKLGDALRDGIGAPQDLTAAAQSYKTAQDAGLAIAHLRLANLYLVVPERRAEGLAMLEAAVEDGTKGAALALANAYIRGTTGSVDIPSAISLLTNATSEGDVQSGRRLIRLYVDGVRWRLDRDPKAARQVLTEIAPALDEWTLFKETLAIDASEARSTDYSALLSRFDQLDEQEQSALVSQMGPVNPNSYVLFMQSILSKKGIYSGPMSGMLSQSTISAFNSFCRSSDAAEECSGGPLSPEARMVLRANII